MKRKIKKLRRQIIKIEDPFERDLKKTALDNLEYGLTLELFFKILPKDISEYFMKKAYNELLRLIKGFDIYDIGNIMGMVIRRRSSFVKEKRTQLEEIVEDYRKGYRK